MTSSQEYQHSDDFDPHFKIFHELMPFKVREILLVSSSYDAYILEEDGSLASRIINEYQGLNLSHPPRITRAASAEQALDMLGKSKFDLVVTMPHLGGMDGCAFGELIKKHHKVPVILLGHSVRDTLVPKENCLESGGGANAAIDESYVWGCDSELLLAIVKSVEDRVNAAADTAKAMVRIIILVEDSALYRSTLLPVLYSELVRQTQAVLDESLNEQHRLLKMRARPRILTAASYERAMELFNQYKPYVFAIISDVRFPMGGETAEDAGFCLLRAIREQVPDLPMLMLSTDPANKARALQLPAVFAQKNSADVREDIHDFFLDYLGFGDFVFRLPDEEMVGVASSLREFEEQLKRIPDKSLFYHALNNHLSNWVMARGEVALAARLSKEHFAEITTGEELREDIVFKVHALRQLRLQGVVAQFSAGDYDPEITDFVRIGRGSMGGKARGVAFFFSRLRRWKERYPLLAEFNVRIPRTCVIAADGFDQFIEKNKLTPPGDDEEEDESIAARFLGGRLPDWLSAHLRAFLVRTTQPLSVRSSSLLEDAQFRPYAGLYNTFMLANDHHDFAVRLEQLERAVKLVYASTWFANPRAFSRSVGQVRKDSMAVIIQQLVGTRCGDHFYPPVSGVAQSYNYYPVAPMRAGDGIAHIAVGFGKTVVEGERSLRFCPRFPENLPQFSTVDDILANAQCNFYSLDCGNPARFLAKGGNLVRRSVEEAAGEYPLRLLCSTYVPAEHRIRDVDMPGHRVVTFAALLKHCVYPLPGVLAELTALGREGMGCEVEIEFSLDLAEEPAKSTLYFLQIRPMVTGGEARRVLIGRDELRAAFIRANESLGHGLFTNMRDIVYVAPERFDIAASREVAAQVGALNSLLDKERRPYLLIGPGRWGTADPWLGIPVQWGDISGVGAMIELLGRGVRAEPSQGSHFFQNITSLGIPYLMVSDEGGTGSDQAGGLIDWQYLQSLPLVRETAYVRHVRQEQPFVLKVNGRDSKAVVFNTP